MTARVKAAFKQVNEVSTPGYILDGRSSIDGFECVSDFHGLLKFATEHAHRKLYTTSLNGVHFILQSQRGITRVGWFPDVMLKNKEGVSKALLDLKYLARNVGAKSMALASAIQLGDEQGNKDEIEIFGVTSFNSMLMRFQRRALRESKACKPLHVENCSGPWVRGVQNGLSVA